MNNGLLINDFTFTCFDFGQNVDYPMTMTTPVVDMFDFIIASILKVTLFILFYRDLSSALITLFMLFTMDHWRALMLEVQKVPELDNITCSLYIISWLFIGSFILRNISVGIMGRFQYKGSSGLLNEMCT